MEKEILKLKISDIFDLSLNPLGNDALLRSKKVNKKLKKYFAEKTFDDLKIVMYNMAHTLSCLKINSDKVIEQKKYGYYEIMFQDLIKYDIRFLAFANRETLGMPKLDITIARLVAIGEEDFNIMLDMIKDNIKKNDGFKKHYLNAFKSAKEKLSTTVNV